MDWWLSQTNLHVLIVLVTIQEGYIRFIHDNVLCFEREFSRVYPVKIFPCVVVKARYETVVENNSFKSEQLKLNTPAYPSN